MADPSVASASAETSIERLVTAVERLTENIRVLTAMVQDAREELQWITRNGVPHQMLTVRVVSGGDEETGRPVMPLEADSRDTLPSDPPVTARELEAACEWLGEHVTELLQEQLNLFVAAVQPVTPKVSRSAPRPSAAEISDPAVSIPSTPLRQPTSPSNHRSQSLFPFDPDPEMSVPSEREPAEILTQSATTGKIPASLPPLRMWNIGDAADLVVDGREVWGEVIELNDAENRATIQLIPSGQLVILSQDELVSNWAPHQRDRSQGKIYPQGVASFLETDPTDDPVTLATFVDLQRRLAHGTIDADELRRVFVPCYEARGPFCAMLTERLNRSELRSLAATLRCLDATGRATKATLALNCYHALLETFTLNRPVVWKSVLDSFEDAVANIVSELTDDDLRVYAASMTPPDPHTPPFAADLTSFGNRLSRSQH